MSKGRRNFAPDGREGWLREADNYPELAALLTAPDEIKQKYVIHVQHQGYCQIRALRRDGTPGRCNCRPIKISIEEAKQDAQTKETVGAGEAEPSSEQPE